MKLSNIEQAYLYMAKHSSPSEAGVTQFRLHQSEGVSPEVADETFNALTHGKTLFDLQSETLRKQYASDWPGFYQLWRDWTGHRWILPLLCKWHRCPPPWIGLEDREILERISEYADVCTVDK